MDNTTLGNNRRIAKNTGILYVRMFITLLIGLYTSRVVLATLGVSDYGLYNVVGGVVAMFGFLNGTLSTSTQRFLNFELGKQDEERLKLVFSTAFLQHVLLIGIIVVLAETLGLWFVINKLNIPEGRETAALWCYQISIAAVCVQVVQLPFMSALIAHEKMNAYAYVSIFDVLAKLLIAYLIQVASADKLVLYSVLILCITIIDTFLYGLYGFKHFNEVRISFKTERPLFKEMLGFSGWNIIGMLASTLNNYGLNILFNLFFGTVINAARAISYQVNGIVVQFSNNFQLAVKPQVVKYYANGQLEEMKKLVFSSAKYSGLLLLALAIPISLEVDFLLKIWLGSYPEHTADFVRIILLQSIILSMTQSVLMAVHASGYLKMIGIFAGGFNLLLLPINYVLLKLGCQPEVAMVVNVFGSAIETLIELAWMQHYINFPIKEFYVKVYGSVFILGLMMFIVPGVIHYSIQWNNDVIRFFVVCISSTITSLFVLYNWGLPQSIKDRVNAEIRRRIKVI